MFLRTIIFLYLRSHALSFNVFTTFNLNPFSRLYNHNLCNGRNWPCYVKPIPWTRPKLFQGILKNNYNKRTTSNFDSLTSYNIGTPSRFVPQQFNFLNQESKVTLASTQVPILETKENHRRTEYIVPLGSPSYQDYPYNKPVPAPADNDIFTRLRKSLDVMERKFYSSTYSRLVTISPPERQENGISFVQSGLFLELLLLALATEVDLPARKEILDCLDLELSNKEIITLLQNVSSWFPEQSPKLQFRWSSRLAFGPNNNVSSAFKNGPGQILKMNYTYLNGQESPAELTKELNYQLDLDSKGTMQETFDEDEVENGIRVAAITTTYLRAAWRTDPTLLNGTHKFYVYGNETRETKMIRINDIMRYADLPEWNAQAVEIPYATPGLSLLMLIPRGRSLRFIAERVANTSVNDFIHHMYSMRVAVSVPLYTLRMTLLLPGKLEMMGIHKLLDNSTTNNIRLSHAVQRLMFWAEAGRNAYKDDGFEWDDPPEMEMLLDRPYTFFVRWQNVTLLSGNFVL